MRAPAFLRRVAVSSLALALGGCSSNDDEQQDKTQAIELAFIPKTSNNLVFQIGYDGAQFGARSLSGSTGVKINVDLLASAELDPEAERQLVRDAISAKKDGLLVSCVDDSITQPIDEAVAAGIPVITYDSDCPDSNRLGFYSMQSEDTGAKSADLLASAMGAGPKSIAILTGRAGSDNLERRLAGFSERLADSYPEITVATTVHCMETAESCGPAVEDDIVAAYPELDGLLVVGLWGLLGACSCSDSGRSCLCEDSQMPKWKTAAKGKLKTVTYDSLPFEVELMKQGYLSALVGQKYFGWGYDTVSLMYDHLTADSQVNDFIDSGFDVVCPNNADEMSEKWQAADFSAPLKPECDL
jgi:ribose transport system substrate-binding protein